MKILNLKALTLTSSILFLGLLVGCSNLKTNTDETDIILEKPFSKVAEPVVKTKKIAAKELNIKKPQTKVKVKAKKNNSSIQVKLKGVKIQSNIAENWLQLSVNDEADAWQNIEEFLKSQGFKVASKRLDTRTITTDFVERKTIAPLINKGFLTKVINKWRDEFVTGAFDRIIVMITPLKTNKSGIKFVNVHFYHNSILDYAEIKDDIENTLGQFRHTQSSPVVEKGMLYSAALFFGVSQKQARQQLERDFIYFDDEKAEGVKGLKVKAGVNQTRDFLTASLYRSGFIISDVNRNENEIIAIVPPEYQTSSEKTKSSIFSFIDDVEKFSKKLKYQLPEKIKFNLKRTTDSDFTEIELDQLSDGSLDTNQRRFILQEIGLVN
jgi:uncharacterized lipoprotein